VLKKRQANEFTSTGFSFKEEQKTKGCKGIVACCRHDSFANPEKVISDKFLTRYFKKIDRAISYTNCW
jgi:hypothetical protein